MTKGFMKSLGNSIRAAIEMLPTRRRLLRPHGQRKHFSARGEDVLVRSWLSTLGIVPTDVRYLDVGACHPISLSNTYLLYQAGGSGVLVEPNPALAEALRRVRSGDIVIVAGAAFDDRQSATLTRMTAATLSTFSRPHAEMVVTNSQKWIAGDRQEILDEIEVPMIPINEIVGRYLGGLAPHFLSIDAEGYDLAILKSLDLDRYGPLLLCIEAGAAADDMLANRYDVICKTPENWLFMSRTPQRWIEARQSSASTR